MKTYKDIPGWFAEEAFYDRMVDRAVDGAVFVEIGCWLGKSTAYLASKIQASGKRIQLYAVDTWEGTPNEPALVQAVADAGGSVLGLFRQNMADAGCLDVIHTMQMDSVQAAGLFDPSGCDFVFIDADHTYEAVRKDIAAWRKNVKPGGILAGHDYCTYESVRKAVGEAFGNAVKSMGNVWFVEQ